jgi:pyruvate formate lyase activating enzyme
MNKREFIRQMLIGAAGIPALYTGLKSSANPIKFFEMNIKGNAPQMKYFKEAYHYEMNDNDAQCQLCPNYCYIRPGKTGSCRNRTNQDGKLMTKAYGNPCAVHVDPVEKKPLLHFLPATRAFSIATAGCVLSCLNCQNWDISQTSPDNTENIALMPTAVVDACLENKCESIAYTYSEPTSWYEYAFDTAKLASIKGIKNLWISCGYINEKPLREIAVYLDAANINLKSFSDEIYQKLNGGALEPILRTLKILKEMGVWLEITNLVVPTWTDDLDMIRRMSQWLVKEGFADYPLHFNRFFPLYKLTHLPATPSLFLDQARAAAMEEGMKYVYVGNVPGSEYADTYCPNCKKKIIDRTGYRLTTTHLKEGRCKYCDEKIAGVWS